MAQSDLSQPVADSPDLGPARRTGRRPLGQRRSFLVDRRYQVRAGLLAVGVVLILLLLVNLTLHSARVKSSEAAQASAPALAEWIQAQDRWERNLALVASLVFLVGVFSVSILETHKTAGAAHNLGLRLGEIAAGRYDARLCLRKGDNLIELEGGFNEMAAALTDRATRHADRLVELANDADAARQRELAGKLRDLASELRTRS